MSDEAAIRELMDDWAKAVRKKDADGVLRHFAPDIVIYDLAPPLRSQGADRKGMGNWFATWDGPIDYELTDLDVTVGGDVAFAHGLGRIGGRKADGSAPSSIWVRVTAGFRKIDGEWKVVHDHSSVPFYMDGSEKAGDRPQT